ncbi:mechanosensitive ion channel family protein [Nevskia ramosa]|uniref:mechanosensitive ion channel family protein n=1 Tax=Nevskia ramosa TaxID=64002 RepID=UPI0003B540B4|nr:mechanosensitive ion channel domain-containing protein [Nevskia ramosa]
MDFKLEQLTQPERWLELGLPVLLKVAVAFLIFFLGRFVVRMAVKVLRSVMQRANADPTLTGFLGNVVYGLGYALVVISALGQIGINTNSLAAVVGGAALAVGLALQGQLSAFAAGVLLILFRPFRVGDFVDAGGIKGTVEEIKIIHTVLRTADNQEVIVPNNTITAATITNYSARNTRRLDITIGIDYDADLKLAKSILQEIVLNHPKVLKSPAPTVQVRALGASSVDFAVWPWAKTAEWGDVQSELLEQIKLRFDAEGIAIPYPQMDLHLRDTGGDGERKTLPVENRL